MPELRDLRLGFSGQRLTTARQLRGLTRADVARRVNVTAAAISQFESGQTQPRPETLARLALTLGVTPTFFTRRPSVGRLLADEWHFRSLRATRKAERDRVLARVSLLAEIVEYVERFIELPVANLPEHLVAAVPDSSGIEAAAMELRAMWDLGLAPISSMVRLLELHGCIVARIAAESDSVDAFSGHVGARPFVILAMDKGDVLRSRFDAAHELGHLVLHADVNPGSSHAEKEAHLFASSFLLPRDAVAEQLPASADWDRLLVLKQHWGASLQALLYRARQIGRLTEPAYRRAMTQLSRRGWRRNEPGDVAWEEAPTLLADSFDLLERARGLGRETLLTELDIAAEDYDAVVETVQRMNIISLAESRPGLAAGV